MPRIHHEENDAINGFFNSHAGGYWGVFTCQRMKIDPFLTSYKKLTQKGIEVFKRIPVANLKDRLASACQ